MNPQPAPANPHPATSNPAPAEPKMSMNEKKIAFQSYYGKVNNFAFSKDLVEIAPQIKTLEKLLDYETKIDKILSKKKVDIQEQLLRPFPKIKRILRVHLYNTFNNEEGNWTLKIEGKLLNTDKNVICCILIIFHNFNLCRQVRASIENSRISSEISK